MGAFPFRRLRPLLAVLLGVPLSLVPAAAGSAAGAPVHELAVSAAPNRSAAVALAGATIGETGYVFVRPASEIIRVRFFLDDPTMAGSPRQTEGATPYDFAGTAADGTAQPWSTAGLAEGAHTITAAVDLTGGGTELLEARFSVARAVRVNFQSETAPTPTGYLRDFGQGYGARTANGQGSGLTYGWVAPGTATPRDLVGNGRDRDRSGIDQRLDTILHMQGGDLPNFGNVRLPGAWELARPNGTYTVTVGAGDGPSVDSLHQLNVEGSAVVGPFTPTPGAEYRQSTTLTRVLDGRLTVDAAGGRNTKITHVEVVPAPEAAIRPAFTGVTPATGGAGVPRDTALAATVNLPTVGAGVDAGTLTPETVRLVRIADGVAVPANRNTSGGGDIVVLQPTGLLAADTAYRFEISAGVRDTSGAAFLPYSATFTTGALPTGGGDGPVAFDKVSLPSATGRVFTSVTFGPDGRLYAGVASGQILRYPVNADGTLGTGEVIESLRTANGGDRMLMGIAFDPAATAGNLVLWVTHTAYGYGGMPDWTGRISRLSGPALGTVADRVVGLPRSTRDHLTNGLAFGPDGALYVNQGSNTAMGAPDNAWGQRPERALGAAVLRVDVATIGAATLDVQTAEGGTYDPFGSGAPVTVYGSGIRNAWDLVWHSNGRLYVPTNGSAAGGSTPATPNPLPAQCARRLDAGGNGPYTGPALPGLANVPTTQHDYLFRVERGGYYGHPNPARCEWVLNGGNPTAGSDPAEVGQYPVGTGPDRNWRGAAYDFGLNRSPNGVIEYRGNVFGGVLRGRLLVVRYSGGDDIVVLEPGGAQQDIVGAQSGLTGLTGFTDPLDLTEQPGTGNLYVSEYGGQRLTLLRPRA